MKHIFIINPAAGKGAYQKELKLRIEKAALEKKADCEIYETKAACDAERFVREYCFANTGEELCFYACGGDGTLNEVLNGAAGFEFARVGVVPVGTGNDFVKNFRDGKCFFDISAQLDGSEVLVDAMKIGDRYAVNMINMGFDCAVVETVAKIKRRAFIPSGLAYIAGVIVEFVKMPCTRMKKIVIDGEALSEKELQLCAFAGGAFYGGGFHNAPLARLDDGLIDICYVRKVSRLQFIRMIGSYKNGTYLSNKSVMKVANYHNCRNAHIDFESERSVCIDGEITKMRELDIEIVPGAFRFILPKGSFYEGAKEKEPALK